MRTISACLLSLTLFFDISGSTDGGWSLVDINQGWNTGSLVTTYFHNSELQRQWAWELLGKQKLQGDEKILDFGCGDGKISAEISRLVPCGGVTGVDMSSDMLHFARIKFPGYAYPNLDFAQSHSLIFDDVFGEQAYDMVCAFCVFHLIANPLDVLRNLKNHLRPGGRLVLVIPAGKNPVFFTASIETFAKHQLKDPFSDPTVGSMRTLDGCSSHLQEAGYNILSLEMIDTDSPFYNKAELVAWMIGTLSANWNIPMDLSTAFFSNVVERMCELDPTIIDDEGRLHYKISRIHVVAER
jgi:trans-aconitate methyltransferase